MEAQLRRYRQFSSPAGEKHVLTWGDLTLDKESVSVTAAGKDVTVTAREFEILSLLMSYPKKVFTRGQLYEQGGGGGEQAGRRADKKETASRAGTEHSGGRTVTTADRTQAQAARTAD